LKFSQYQELLRLEDFILHVNEQLLKDCEEERYGKKTKADEATEDGDSSVQSKKHKPCPPEFQRVETIAKLPPLMRQKKRRGRLGTRKGRQQQKGDDASNPLIIVDDDVDDDEGNTSSSLLDQEASCPYY